MRMAGDELLIALVNAGGYHGPPGLEDLQVALQEARLAEELLRDEAPMNERMLPEDERALLAVNAPRDQTDAMHEAALGREWQRQQRLKRWLT